jgi:predicted HAD superfamily Cof-like phosphohydrolase
VSTVHQMVREFHEKYGLHYQGPPRNLPPEIMMVKVGHLAEELAELMDGVREQDLTKTLDALVDLVYVAVGYAYLAGLPFDEAFLEVHAANMRKVRCERPEDSRRGTTFDVIKPSGWVGPNIAELILREFQKFGGAVTLPVEMLDGPGDNARGAPATFPEHDEGISTKLSGSGEYQERMIGDNFDNEQVPLQ